MILRTMIRGAVPLRSNSTSSRNTLNIVTTRVSQHHDIFIQSVLNVFSKGYIYILFISTRNYRCTYNNNNFQKGRAVVKRGLAILFATRNLAQSPFHTFVTVPRFLTRRLELSQPSVLNFSATSKTDGQRFFASIVPVRALFVIISPYPSPLFFLFRSK